MKRPGRFTGAVLGAALLVVLVQVYLFETVLGEVLDGRRSILPGAFAVSAVLSVLALVLAFRVRRLDR